MKIKQHTNSHDTDESLGFHPTTQDTLLDKLKQIKSRIVSGFDGQPPRLGIGAAILSRTLLPIISEAISESSFPIDLKKSEVIPVFKKDDRMNKEKYRHLCITMCLKTLRVYHV